MEPKNNDENIDSPIVTRIGYQPGLIGAITTSHGVYYSEFWGFDTYFEGRVAAEVAEFINRYDEIRDHLASLWREDTFMGSIVVDGGYAPETAQLRWFIVDKKLHGSGHGKHLCAAAVSFAREQGYQSMILHTFKGLDAARHLYESFGFELIDETTGRQWGRLMTEQTFKLTFED